MALTKIPFRPGFNKQITDTQAENVWVNGDNVRFRYGQAEKIGGWLQINANTLIGVARAQHVFTDLDGRKYAAIGTNRCLYIYYSGDLYDITPIDPDRQQTGADITTTNGSTTVTITTTTAHNLEIGDILTFENAGSFTGGQTDYTATDFDDVLFEVKTIPTATTFTIEMPTAETGTGATNDGTLDPLPYIDIGGLNQTLGFGWGAGRWGQSTWGTARSSSNTNIDPGFWSLDNFGQILIATVHNGRTFKWSPLTVSGAALTTRAVSVPNNPTKSVMTIVSDRDRHLIHLGTETIIGNKATQDKMFIRFSDQEDIEDYQPTSVNTAGTFRIDSGSDIRGASKGKDYTFIGTDTAAYIMQFVGPPFTFSIRQVGSNCGVLGQNAMVFVDTTVYWMSDEGGFFVYDGSVKKMPCLVEDFVFKTTGNNPGLNFNAGQQVYAAHNSLFSEIIWFYPDASSQFANRMVVYNYQEGTWTTGTLARTSYTDKSVFDKPYATKFEQNVTPSFPVVNGITSSQGRSLYYEHETGVNEVDANGNKTAIAAFIESGDFDLDAEGDGQFFIKIRRFIPDFKVLNGNAKITLDLRDYPNDTATSSPLGPFTVTSSTDKIDTRARARLAALKIENDSTDENWRLGLFRVDIQPDGRR
jgi:hypothetical protein